MGWQTTMTKQGLSVLAGLDGQSVKIVSAWAGNGSVDEYLLREQTELVEPKLEMAVIEDYAYENTRDLRLQIWSKNVKTGFLLTQLGIFISVDESEPLLYIIAQNTDGESIPSGQTTPNFILEYLMSLTFAYGSEVTIEVKEVGFITPDALDVRLKHFREELELDLSGTKTAAASAKKRADDAYELADSAKSIATAARNDMQLFNLRLAELKEQLDEFLASGQEPGQGTGQGPGQLQGAVLGATFLGATFLPGSSDSAQDETIEVDD